MKNKNASIVLKCYLDAYTYIKCVNHDAENHKRCVKDCKLDHFIVVNTFPGTVKRSSLRKNVSSLYIKVFHPKLVNKNKLCDFLPTKKYVLVVIYNCKF
jgi:hypothetical protein